MRWLEDLFRCREVDRDPRLKIICGCLLFYYFLTFYHWWQAAPSLSTAGNKSFDYLPSAIAQNMRWLVFMDLYQTHVYMYALGMAALFGLFSLFYLRSSLVAMLLLAFLFLNKTYFYLNELRLFTNYHHFHLFYTLIILFSREKLRFFRLALVVSYLMSAVVKLSPSWLGGEYFNSFADKLPLFPKVAWLVTALSAGVFLLEAVGPLVWFTGITWLRRATFVLFFLFHVYSGVIVAFWYTSLMLPLVVAAFLGFRRPLQAGYRFARRDVWPLGIMAGVVLGGFYHYSMPGDVRLTCEGRYLGFFMFDANRQVTFNLEIQKGEKIWEIEVFRSFQNTAMDSDADFITAMNCKYWQGETLKSVFTITRPIEDENQIIFNPVFFQKVNSRKDGDPYVYYFYARELTKRYHPDRVSLQLDVQLNGHSEMARLLDIRNFCRLNPTYNLLSHNSWIKVPGTNAPMAYRWP